MSRFVSLRRRFILYQIGDKIVHPMHGAGVVEDIIKKDIGGTEREYYVLKLPVGDMVIMVPTESTEQIGVRDIVDAPRADEVMHSVETAEIDMTQNWSRRYRENVLRLKSGDLDEVVKVIKGLALREYQHGLSTGERKMLHSAKNILISELVLAKQSSFEVIESELDDALKKTVEA